MAQTTKRKSTLTEQIEAARARVAASRIGDRKEFRETMDRLKAEKEKYNREAEKHLGLVPA
jgi:hypothetical protein